MGSFSAQPRPALAGAGSQRGVVFGAAFDEVLSEMKLDRTMPCRHGLRTHGRSLLLRLCVPRPESDSAAPSGLRSLRNTDTACHTGGSRSSGAGYLRSADAAIDVAAPPGLRSLRNTDAACRTGGSRSSGIGYLSSTDAAVTLVWALIWWMVVSGGLQGTDWPHSLAASWNYPTAASLRLAPLQLI